MYEGSLAQAGTILDAMYNTYQETGIAINSVTCGRDVFVRYWPTGESEQGDNSVSGATDKYWRAYALEHLSPSYFIGNLIDVSCNVDREETDYAWFAHPDGKHSRMISERRVQNASAI